MKKIIRSENVCRSYRQGELVLDNVNFDIEEQEFVGIMGRSGSGKTTLLKLLGLIDLPTEGDIFLLDKNMT